VLPDGGLSLRERLPEVTLIEAMVTILPQYGQLQREVAPSDTSLLILGVNDMRAATKPSRFDDALEAVGEYVERCGNEDDRMTYQRVGALRGTFASWCDRLAAVPASPSLTTTTCIRGTSWSLERTGPTR